MTQNPEPERFFSRLNRLMNFFARTKGGGFLFGVCDDLRLIKGINQGIVNRAGIMGFQVKPVFLSSDNIDNYRNTIRSAAEKEPKGLVITNFDELIRISDGQVIPDINMARDALIMLNIPLMFWFSNENMSLFIRKAPDIYSRRSGVVDFSDLSLPDELAWLEKAISTQAQMGNVIPEEILKTILIGLRSQRDELKGIMDDLRSPRSMPQPVEEDTILNIDRDKPPETPDEALKVYCRILAGSARRLPLRGVDLGASDPGREKHMELDRVYVELNTTAQVSLSKGRGEEHSEKSRLLRAIEAAAQNRRVVFLGNPGAGKSTFASHLSLCLALHHVEPLAGWLDRLTGWPEEEGLSVPIQVVLRDFARSLPENPGKAESSHLWRFIEKRLESQDLDFAADPLKLSLERGQAVVLLDGLDEIPTGKQRAFVRDAVEAFARRYEGSRIIVTCRVLSYQDEAWRLADFPFFELAPFDDEMIQRFIQAWHGELLRLNQIRAEQEEGMNRRLAEAVRRPDLKPLAVNPLLLTVMALVNTHKGRLPEARALLYEETVEILLWRWDEIKSQGEDSPPRLRELLMEAGKADVDLKRALWSLAFQAHGQSQANGQDMLADIHEWQLVKALADLYPEGSRDWADQIITTIKYRAGLLIEREPGLYSFPHRTFQEYLAGAHLSSQGNFAIEAAKLAGEGSFWREVILLAVGRLVYLSGDSDRPLALAGELCPHHGEDTETGWQKAWLAGEVLREIGLYRVKAGALGRDMLVRVQHRLAALLKKGALKPVERAGAGNTLAVIGDPRFDPDQWYLPKDEMLGFVEIPAGPFLMGSDKKRDKEAYPDELPQHPVELSTYYISRYLVTAAQFKAFVEDSRYEPKDRDCLNGVDNHPVVWVSWDEAVKYCEWLTDKLKDRGWRICLPTEAQWEKAARGVEGRIYPWGDEIDPDKANYRDTGMGGTSPVGCFPKDTSPYGVSDMAGNVLEWCQDWYDSDYYKKHPSKDPTGPNKGSGRVIRGGAWGGVAGDCRAAYRHGYGPALRDQLLGFRLVLLPGR
jgi:formylglycine-generating enzyme required for sulfatase activity